MQEDTEPQTTSAEGSDTVPGESPAWHALEAQAVGQLLDGDVDRGLSSKVAETRRQRFGANRLELGRRKSALALLLDQFRQVLVLVLLLAAILSLVVGEWVDALTIFAIVVLNACLGFAQEWRAERALEALERLLEPMCQVVRDGRSQTLPAEELVPGDVVLLDSGDHVPADLRLQQATGLLADESALTGESSSVAKSPEPVAVTAALPLRSSMLFLGTAVTQGHGRAWVVATGLDTELGSVARLTEAAKRPLTPLERQLRTLGRQLGLFSLVVSVLVGLVGLWSGRSWIEMFFISVALAVAVIPEGLPAVVTVTLALGVRSMARRRALLRRLQAAETLGETSVICTDKTGTLTANQMTVRRIWLAQGPVIEVEGVGYEPTGSFRRDEGVLEPQAFPDLMALLRTACVCNHASVTKEAGGIVAAGEPTEAALVVLAMKGGLAAEVPRSFDRELPFSSERKRMTVLAAGHVYSKGAPEALFERCASVQLGDQTVPFDVARRQQAEKAYEAFAREGLRTLALAQGESALESSPCSEEALESDLTLLGLVGLLDPPRAEVPEALRTAQEAGLRVVAITGDAAATASHVARRLGLETTATIEGPDLDGMGDEALDQALLGQPLFARTSPAQKLRIVERLQEAGEVVAMTGDGVNDAPALKQADIGIAMGIRGTDVAKGASDMVLADDNFASIVGAVEEGRRQYDNIQKFVRYLLSSNFAEIVAIAVNIGLGSPLILLPVQILWMNLVTDGLVAIALGLEPAEPDLMRRHPRSRQARILDREGVLWLLGLGSYMGLAAVALFQLALALGVSVDLARTWAFTALILLEKWNVFNFRFRRASWLWGRVLSNPWLVAAWMLSLGLQLLVVYLPTLQRAFHTVPLGARDWLLIAALCLPVIVLPECVKAWLRHRQAGATSS